VNQTQLPALGAGLMLVSGAASLGWQMLWTTQLGTGLGHEMVSTLAVLAAFFGGMSLGALACGRSIDRIQRPGAVVAILECLMAAWGLGLATGLPALSGWIQVLIGPQPTAIWHWLVAFLVPFALLLPATAAMGASLPLLERTVGTSTRSINGLYAANTLGAVIGALGMVFWSIPHLGLQQSAGLCSAANAACAVFSWLSLRSVVAPATSASEPIRGSGISTGRITLLMLGSGFLGVGYEVLAVRVLSQATENTVYSYALLIAVYLLGTATGAAFDHARSKSSPTSLGILISGLAASVLVGGGLLWWADRLSGWPILLFGAGSWQSLAGEALAAAAALLLPSLIMGATFTRICRYASVTRENPRANLGYLISVNTLGGALAPAAIGMMMIPGIGPKLTLVAITVGYIGLAIFATQGATNPLPWLVGLVACATIAFAPPLRLLELPMGSEILSYRDGVMSSVSVVRDDDGVSRLRINNRTQEGSSAGGMVETRLAQLPMLLHPAPAEILFLGLGTGYTARAAAQHALSRVTAVELLPEVIDASQIFAKSANAPQPAFPVRIVAADARRFVLSSPRQYDVIVSDLFHPARSGAGSLYTVEHFSAVRKQLAPGGLFCQWLALHQMELDTLRGIIAAFQTVYPTGFAVLASNSLDTPVIGLIARPDAPQIRPDLVRKRLAQASSAEKAALNKTRLIDEFSVLGSVVAGPQALKAFSDDIVPNSDDRPDVAHKAPWDTYAPRSSPRARLIQLSSTWRTSPEEILLGNTKNEGDRLKAYWEARTRYLGLGTTIQPDDDPLSMLQKLREPLLELLETSPDFQPAYDPLFALATALMPREPGVASEVLGALSRLHRTHASN